MKEVKRGNAIINYQITGNGEITLLFVHGSYIDQTYWKSQVEFFNQHYTVVTIDLPGHGQSGMERKHWSVQGFAEDVIAIISDLHLEHVILIGHSMGADVNLIAATLYPPPIVGFISIENFKNAGMPQPQENQQKAADIERRLAIDFRDTNEQYARMALLTDKTSPAISKRVVEAYRNANQSMGMATTPEIFTLFQVEKRLLPQLHFKLYLINVDYMPTNEAPLQQYAGCGYELLHMRGSSHFPMLESPLELNKLLDECIQKIAVNVLHDA